MSPKDFRKISHLEPKILNSLVNCGRTLTQTDRRSRLDVELTPLPVGQLKTGSCEVAKYLFTRTLPNSNSCI